MTAAADSLIEHIQQELGAGRLVLPSLPAVIYKIRDAVNDERNGPYQLAKLIQLDPGLAARLIQIANSPIYRPRVAIDSVQLAISHLGLSVTRDLVTCLVLHNVFHIGQPALKQEIEKLWRHSCHVAAISYVIARINPGFQPDKAMLSGLLHDIGELPVLYYAADYPELIEQTELLQELRQRLRGELGRELLQRWHFAEDMVQVPENAEQWQRDAGNSPDYSDLVIVAQRHSYFGSVQDGALPGLLELPAFNKLAISRMGPEASLELLHEARHEIESIRQFLN